MYVLVKILIVTKIAILSVQMDIPRFNKWYTQLFTSCCTGLLYKKSNSLFNEFLCLRIDKSHLSCNLDCHNFTTQIILDPK